MHAEASTTLVPGCSYQPPYPCDLHGAEVPAGLEGTGSRTHVIVVAGMSMAPGGRFTRHGPTPHTPVLHRIVATIAERIWNHRAPSSPWNKDQPQASTIKQPRKPVITARYLTRSLSRLAVMTDVPFTRSRKAVCAMLQAYGYALPDAQREALEHWCQGQ